MGNWSFVHIGVAGDDCRIGGLAVWKPEPRWSRWRIGKSVFFPRTDPGAWRPIDAPLVRLAHPQYPNQIHDYRIYEIGDRDRPVRFAACELSNNVWGFYEPA